MSNVSDHFDPGDDTWTVVRKLTRDLANAAKTMTVKEARFLVDNYYAMQRNRIRAGGQQMAMSTEPHETLSHLHEQSKLLEEQIKRALHVYAENKPIGQWLMGITGIGPVIAAGLLAHIDIEKAPTVGHIWAFAGLDPTKVWEKGKKRPHNAGLKVVCWKAGHSFMMNSGRESCFYGKLYKERKALEIERNNNGLFAGQAADILAKKKFDKSTDAYKAYSVGKLPPAHIDARARRYAVKLFLAHLHEVMYRERYGTAPPLPYPIAHLGHAHIIPAP